MKKPSTCKLVDKDKNDESIIIAAYPSEDDDGAYPNTYIFNIRAAESFHYTKNTYQNGRVMCLFNARVNESKDLKGFAVAISESECKKIDAMMQLMLYITSNDALFLSHSMKVQVDYGANVGYFSNRKRKLKHGSLIISFNHIKEPNSKSENVIYSMDITLLRDDGVLDWQCNIPLLNPHMNNKLMNAFSNEYLSDEEMMERIDNFKEMLSKIDTDE